MKYVLSPHTDWMIFIAALTSAAYRLIQGYILVRDRMREMKMRAEHEREAAEWREQHNHGSPLSTTDYPIIIGNQLPKSHPQHPSNNGSV